MHELSENGSLHSRVEVNLWFVQTNEWGAQLRRCNVDIQQQVKGSLLAPREVLVAEFSDIVPGEIEGTIQRSIP